MNRSGVTQTRTTALLQVPGAALHYEVRGTGPLLLVGQSGAGAARRSEDLVDQLTDDFTVVTYDRRGLSHSTIDDPTRPVTPQVHADDLHRLLAALTDEPALMLGCSLGATYGLELVKRHPEQVSVLVAHDAAAPALLPDTSRSWAIGLLSDVYDTYRSDGWRAAMAKTAKATAIDLAAMETEPGISRALLSSPQDVADMEFFLGHDIDALRRSTFDATDVAALRESPTRIVPAAGASSHAAWNHRCTEELARILGTGIVEFPGGHNGNTTHPRAFAATLRDVLA